MVRTDGLYPQTAVLHRFGEVTAQWGPWLVGDPTVLVQKFSKRCSEAGLDDRVSGWQDSARRIGDVSDQLACEVVVMIGHRGDRHPDKAGAVHESDCQNLSVPTPDSQSLGQRLRAEAPVPAEVAGCSCTGAASCCQRASQWTTSASESAFARFIVLDTRRSNRRQRYPRNCFPTSATRKSGSTPRGHRNSAP